MKWPFKKKLTLHHSAIIALIFTLNISAETKTGDKQGLIAYWNFDEGSGSTVKDQSGNKNNDGKLFGEPKWTKMPKGYALEFDGVKDYIDCGNIEKLNSPISYTLEAWIKATRGNSVPFSKGYMFYPSASPDNGGFVLYYQNTGDLVFRIMRDNAGNAGREMTLKEDILDNWTYIAITYDYSTRSAMLYKNGENKCSAIFNTQYKTNETSFKIGALTDNSRPYYLFKGFIDEVKMYDRVLDPTEIRLNFLRTAGNYGVAIPSTMSRSTNAIQGKETHITWTIYKNYDEGGKAVVDKYGQFIYSEWPGKVKSDDQLKKERTAEMKLLSAVPQRDINKFDAYGGYKYYKKLKSTGYFRVEKIDGKWWFITPEGNIYLFFAACGGDPFNWGSGSPYKNDNVGKTRQFLYAEMPDPKLYPQVYQNYQKAMPAFTEDYVNFVLLNTIKKYADDDPTNIARRVSSILKMENPATFDPYGYGFTPPIYSFFGEKYEENWAELHLKRMNAWGFNSIGLFWSPTIPLFFKVNAENEKLKLPYVWKVYVNCKRVNLSDDPFDPEFLQAVENAFTNKCIDLVKNDPWLIGWFTGGERGWNIGSTIKPMLNEKTSAAYKAFLDFFVESYKKKFENEFAKDISLFNREVNGSYGSFEEFSNNVKTKGLDYSAKHTWIYNLFIKMASKKFHESFAAVLKKHDKNHLWLGTSLIPDYLCCVEWVEGSLPYIDVISYNWYAKKNNVSKWVNYTTADKPMIRTEFGFCAGKDRGFLATAGGEQTGTGVGSQKERGLWYRYAVENSLHDHRVLGQCWFMTIDQPITGRNWGGEAFNYGLINGADQPYLDMIDEMKKTHGERAYKIHLGLEKAATAKELGITVNPELKVFE